MSKMNHRVAGLIGIASRMANWNADFTGMPKTTSDGFIFGSDKALKYSMKKYWEGQGKRVLYIRSYKIDAPKNELEKLQPRTLDERYEFLFQEKPETNVSKVLNNLFSCIDVLNFGATFAVKDQNIGLTGVVQIGQGFNKWEGTMTEVQDILSPFRNSNEQSEDKDATSLGKKRTVNEAHYVYPFTVNPNHYDAYIGMKDLQGFEGYTVEAYDAFVDAALVGATALNTNSKSGCENEFALFIEFKENAQTYLPNLDNYVEVKPDGNKILYDLSALTPLISKVKNDISSIKIYFNPYVLNVKFGVEGVKWFDIFTRELLTQ